MRLIIFSTAIGLLELTLILAAFYIAVMLCDAYAGRITWPRVPEWMTRFGTQVVIAAIGTILIAACYGFGLKTVEWFCEK